MIETLVSVIITLCNLKGTNLTDQQLKCIDHYNNCLVVDNGIVKFKKLTVCNKAWEDSSGK